METAGRAGCYLACPIELPVRAGTVRFVVISHLSTCLRASGKGAHHCQRYCLVFVAGHPTGQTPLSRGALVCNHAHTGMGMIPSQGPSVVRL